MAKVELVNEEKFITCKVMNVGEYAYDKNGKFYLKTNSSTYPFVELGTGFVKDANFERDIRILKPGTEIKIEIDGD